MSITYRDQRLTDELARRAAHGQHPRTLAEIETALAAIGYKFDRSCDSHSNNRHMTGEAAGESYPAINAYVIEKDTRRSFANVEARRDENFKTLQDMRFSGEWFAVIKGAIFEI